jgi:hypothetical protein
MDHQMEPVIQERRATVARAGHEKSFHILFISL